MTRRLPSLGRIAAHLILFSTALSILAPLAWVVRTSLVSKKVAYLIPPDWSAPLSLSSYYVILYDQPFIKYLWNSLSIGAVATTLSLIVGVPAAFAMSRFNTGGSLLRIGILGAQILPAVALAIPVFTVVRMLHLFDTPFTLMIVYVSFNLPYVIWILAGFFAGLPPEVEEAALIDGCSPAKALILVVIPMAQSGIVAAGVFSFVLAWNEFLFALVLTGLQARTLPVAVAGLITQAGTQVGPMAAATVLMSLPVVALTFISQRYLVTGLTFASIK